MDPRQLSFLCSASFNRGQQLSLAATVRSVGSLLSHLSGQYCGRRGCAHLVSPTQAQMDNPDKRPVVRQAADKTKQVVVAIMACIVVYRRDFSILVFAVGSIVNSIIGKKLKRVIQQPRPAMADEKTDPGMPSSHATALSFLSFGALLNVVWYNGMTLSWPLVFSGLVVIAAAIASGWRVAVGYHTTSQVLVGWLVGTVNCLVWCKLITPFLLGHF